MKLAFLNPIAEITSENPIEAQTLLSSSMRSYSPRSAGLIRGDERMLILGLAEMPEYIKGVSHDVNLCDADKNAIIGLLQPLLTQ